MEPKWNVKALSPFFALSSFSINGTKVECKDVCVMH